MEKLRLDYNQIFVLGGTGQLGHRIIEMLLSEKFSLPSSVKIFATARRVHQNLPQGGLADTILHKAKEWGSRVSWMPFDLDKAGLDFDAQFASLESNLQIGTKTKTLFVLSAAYTNVDGCETDPALCERINETNTLKVLQFFSEKFKSKNVFFSTDYVFDGKEGPYLEDDFTSPTSRYGQSKLFIEDVLLRDDPGALIVRTTGVYDYLPGSKNFLMQMLLLWGEKKQTKIPSDQLSNPVWAKELAEAACELLAKQQFGIYHIAGAQVLPRDQFARQIAESFKLDSTLILPVLTSDLGQKAKRPLKSGLLCSKLKATLGWAPREPKAVFTDFTKQRQT